MLTEFQQKKLARRFELLDVDGNGYLERTDFTSLAARVCEQLIPVDDADGRRAVREGYESMWQHLVRAADDDADARISLTEYQRATAENLISNQEVYENSVVRIITAIFAGLDADGDGSLSQQEVVRYGQAINVSAEDAAALFATIDTDGSGKVTLDEFLVAARDFWQGSDPQGVGNIAFGRVL